jgi:ABC-type amino acid transport system permease subunit
MEWWILLALLIALAVIAAVTRLRKTRRSATGKEKNIYPLW